MTPPRHEETWMRTRFAAQLSIFLTLSAVSVAAALSYTSVSNTSIRIAPDIRPESTPPGSSPSESGPVFAAVAAEAGRYNFYFTRGAYNGTRNSWRTDFPEADRWIANVLGRLTAVDVSPSENPVRLDDPELRRFPFLYMLEVGNMALRDHEVEALRSYLLAGGFVMIDDFWGSWQWANFENQIRQVLPEYEIVEIPMDHPIFSTFYQIDEVIQVPVVNSGISGGPTYEQDGYVPRCLGIFDEHGRLMVMINWNTDIGDAWEHAEHPRYPVQYSTYAYQIAANTIIYALTR
jgi:hypothetical protein